MTRPQHQVFLINISITLSALLCSAVSVSPHACALPFVKVGPTVGYGVGIIPQAEDINESITTVVVGGAALLDIPVVKIEIDLLYLMQSYEVESTLGVINTTSTSTYSSLSIPVIARYNLSPIPLFDLGIGAGYEYRFNIGDDARDTSQSTYIPISARADFKVPMLASLGVETRFSYDLGDLSRHDFMLLAHIAF